MVPSDVSTIQLAAIFFCDVVGSTEALMEGGEERWDARRRSLDALVADAVTSHRGRIVKGLGDGAMAAFDTPSQALAAAVEVQQATTRRGEVSVRIGVSTGEVAQDDGDLFGTPVVEAARLCAVAEPGQILASAAAAALTRHGTVELSSIGPVLLKGFPAPMEAFEARFEPQLEPTAEPPGIPAVLRIMPSFPFVARPREWDALERAWDAVRAGGCHLVLVRGEPGAGKTRLVAEFARRRALDDAAVLFGACREDGGPPYEAFAEALSDAPVSLFTVDPEITNGPGEDRRDVLFREVSDHLAAIGEVAPVLLVLDDMHWARRPTVQLLLHLLRTRAQQRLCIVVTHRDAPDDIGEAFGDAIAELHRLEGVTRVPVPGLDERGVARFVEAATGSPIDATLARTVGLLARQTDGNPFLLGELWRHLVETGSLQQDAAGQWHADTDAATPGTPEAVRAVVGRRIERLPAPARELLEVAAIVGPTFSLDIVADSAGTDRAASLELLEPALASATLEETGAGTFRFSHALVRRAIYDRVSLTRRTRLHLDIARAMERRGVTDRTLPELARHYAAAVPLADAGEAIAVAIRAADAAMRSLAYEDAADLLERVLPFVDDSFARAELLLQIADANLSSGDNARVQAHMREVMQLAHVLGRSDIAVRAALAFEESSWRLGLPGAEAERLLRQVLPDVGSDATRIRVLAARGRALALSGEPGADHVIEDAIAAARELGDPDVLVFALNTWFNLPWAPQKYGLMLERSIELRDLVAANPTRRPWTQVHAQQWLVVALMLNGRFSELAEARAEHTRMAESSQQPFHRHLSAAVNSTCALMEGRFADAEAEAERANELSTIISGTDTSGAYGVQMFSLRREQGRLDEVRPVVEAVVRLDRAHAAWRPGLAAMYAELDMLDAARAEVKYLVQPGLLRTPRDGLFLGTLTYFADAIVAVGDRSAAAIVYAELEPYRGTVAVVGHNIAASGAVDRYLGSLAETAGRARDAARHYVDALALDTRSGSPVWLAHTQYRYARFLTRQGRRDGPRRASDLVAEVIATTRRIGMPALEARALALDAQLADIVPAPDVHEPAPTQLAVGLTPREREIITCLVDGLSNAEIGTALHCSPNTAANHVRSILMKTGCANRTEAAGWAVRNGLVTD